MQKTIPVLTARQRFWLDHIRTWEASGTRRAKYAASKNIAVRTMCSGGKTLMLKDILPATQPVCFPWLQVMAVPGERTSMLALPEDCAIS